MKKWIKKLPVSWVLAVCCVLAAALLIFTISLKANSSSVGSSFGRNIGTLAGRAVGSVQGMTEGSVSGTKAGREAGKSAEDTCAFIEGEFRQISRLEVLAASVKLSNFHKVGENVKYAALYLVNGNVVFTVDLAQTEVRAEGQTLQIRIPQPECDLYIDDSSIEKAAEYQRKLFNGSAEDGYDIYLNSMKKLHQVSEDTLSNYNELLEAAKASAEKQVTALAQSASKSFRDVTVEFMDGKEAA